MMTLAGLALFVADVERSLAFYRDVLGGVETADSQSPEITVQLGEQRLWLRPKARQTPPAITLTFFSHDLPETLSHLARCDVAVFADTKTADSYSFCDPDGNRIWLQKA